MGACHKVLAVDGCRMAPVSWLEGTAEPCSQDGGTSGKVHLRKGKKHRREEEGTWRGKGGEENSREDEDWSSRRRSSMAEQTFLRDCGPYVHTR